MELEKWLSLVGESFLVEGQPVELTLVEAVENASERLKAQLKPDERIPFSLEFKGPSNPLLPQQLYRLNHSNMDPVDLFLVPVWQDESNSVYEAVFN